MNTKIHACSVVIWLSAVSVHHAVGQGTFQNLNFESANVPNIASGQFGSLQPVGNAIPFWSAYVSSNQLSQVLHNNQTVGSPSVSILGPSWNSGVILEGSYTVLLQAGTDPINYPGQRVTAAIAQTGQIPGLAQSLQLRVQGSNFEISFGGLPIAAYELSSAANYKVYGVDVSALAGQTGELRFTSLSLASNPFNWVYLDAISFSAQPIPEPSAFGLFGLGALLFTLRSRLARRS